MPFNAFGQSRPFTLGIEEELLLVRPDCHGLSHTSSALLEGMQQDQRSARHDIYEAQIELSSPVCTDAEQATRSLRRLREALRAAGGTAIGAGIHPAASFGDVQLVQAERYATEAQRLRGLLQRTPDCALHVHVGMPDEETAIQVCNGLRRWVPVLEALGGNSPFWHGRDSGFASARRVLRRGFPRVGIPLAFRDYADYERTVGNVLAAGELDDYTFVWWELRPHPRFGTLEVRAIDSQSSLASVAGLAALLQGLAGHIAEVGPGPNVDHDVLAESSFRAGRDGLTATVHDGERMRSVRDLALEALEYARPHARELGSERPLEEVERLLADGNGADRQRAAARHGGLPAVLEMLAVETAQPYD